MTAKSQPTAGEPGGSDDLIAELAKLMAQDARGEKPAEATRPVMPVRIPGGDAQPIPRFDLGRPAANAAASSQVQQAPATPVDLSARSEPVLAPAEPVRATATPVAAQPDEPFRFDFGLVTPRAAPAQPERAAAPAVAEPAPLAEAAPQPKAADHDSIADLIAAELLGDAETPTPPAPVAVAAPAPQASAAQESVVPVRADEPAPLAPERPAEPQPATRTEQDRFRVAPVFGLGTAVPAKPVAPEAAPRFTPARAPDRSEPTFAQAENPVTSSGRSTTVDDDGLGSDPIDEIETLIGPAMRVELDRSEPVEAAPPKPARNASLRSLATPTLPPQPAPKTSSADDAILAAAQAAGVAIDWVDHPEPVPKKPKKVRRERAPRRSGGWLRALAGPLVAVTLLLAAGFGLYWVLGLGRETGPAPLLTADASPIKETPAVDAEAAPAAQSVVFNEIDGVVPGAEEQLVSRDQADLNEVTQAAPPADVNEQGLANRKVRTVTVRPDGTIVSGEDSVAGSNILPVDRPNVPEVPGAESASPELLAAAAAADTPTADTTASTAVPAAIGTPDAAGTLTPVDPAAETPATPAVTPVTPGATVPVFDTAGNPIAGRTTVVPLTRPPGLTGPGASAASAATSPVNALVDPATATTGLLPPPPAASTNVQQDQAAAAATAAATGQPVEVEALGNTAPAYVQLASQRSEAEARSTAQSMVSRFGPLFGGANLEVQRVDLGARGIYYRVRVPAGSVQDANNICTNVKAAGGDCFTM